MSTMKIRKGDTVKIIAGKDKEKEGKVIAVNKEDGKVLVEGVNMLTKHTKPSAANQNGGIVHQEGPIDISNVMYVHLSLIHIYTGRLAKRELLLKNHSEVMYDYSLIPQEQIRKEE